ncbi:MAG: ABC transporter ATP-binding protein [Thermoproteota archaeon]|jgi:ABC-type branched-subunit amino acid transport system ATPase component
MYVLEVKNLTAGYEKLKIVRNINLALERGEILSVLGPNGAGKSTLLNAIFGIARIFEGKVILNGKEINGKKPYEIARLGIGYTPQIQNVFPNLTVEENLELSAFKRNGIDVKKEIESIFKLFPEIERRRRNLAKTLSGGERQMLAMARALISKPSVLLLDEPTAGLSPKATSTLLKKVKEVVELNVSVILVEQNVTKALETSNRVAVLVGGEFVYQGNASELTREDIEKMFFGEKIKQEL